MKSILLRLTILALILSAPAYFIYKDYSKSNTSEVKDSSVVATTTAAVNVTSNVNTVKAVPTPATSKDVLRGVLPNLDKKWTIPENYSPEAVTIINKRIADITASLKSNNDQYDKWIELGNTRKLVGDYSEASTIWEFTAKVWTDGIVSYNNLGDIYANYLKDKTKAEFNMQKVIELDPHYLSGYISLANFYAQQYGKEDGRVVSTLTKGLNSNLQSVDLMIALAGRYKELDDKTNTKKYYEMALARAKELNNQSLQNILTAEINNL